MERAKNNLNDLNPGCNTVSISTHTPLEIFTFSFTI